jgi:peptidoglycan/LPS O-acetylase OafA/YrhL
VLRADLPLRAQVRSAPGDTRIAGLDGIRAIAVIGVLLYHAGVKALPGGLFGVDVFFVLSGFLITSLLLEERHRDGRISLRRFWIRRLRRLAPALIVVVLAVTLVWGLILHSAQPGLRKDSFFALGYGANWWFAFSGQGYFQSLAPPSPLLHTWSLAVEEQFYLLWPLAVAALTRRGGRFARRVGWWALGIALAATLTTLAQSLAGVWTDRLYYGTDTRVIPLLIGAASGAWLTSRRGRRLPAAGFAALQLSGLACAGGVAWAMCSVGGNSETLYRGGFLLLALAVSVVILAVAMGPSGPLTRLFSTRVLTYLGRISYGLYLWHWPIFLVVDRERTGLSGAPLLVTRLLLSLAFAAASHRLVELPIRQGRWRLQVPRISAPLALTTVAALVVVATPTEAASTGDVAVASQTRIPVTARIGTPQSRAASVGTTRVLFSGDSLALTLANALSVNEAPYRIHIDNASLLGCGVTQAPRRLAGQLNPPDQTCLNWPALRIAQVRQDRPDLVAFLVGRWELTDQYYDGAWRGLGDPVLDAYLASQLDRAIDDLTSTGALVALLTVPCMSEPEQPNGAPYAEADPARVTRFNQLLAAAQKRHPQQSRLVNLNGIVCPGGHFTSFLSGVRIRATDGVHFPFAPIGPVTARLLPQLRALAVESRLHRASTPVAADG